MGTHGKTLEEFLDKFLEQWLPDYAYESFETSESLVKKTVKKFNPQPSTSGISGKKRKEKKKKRKKSKEARSRRSDPIKNFINDGDPEEESDEDSPFDDNLSDMSNTEQLDNLDDLERMLSKKKFVHS